MKRRHDHQLSREIRCDLKLVTFVAPEAITADYLKGGAQTVAAQLYEQFVTWGWDLRVMTSSAWVDSVAPQTEFDATLHTSEVRVVSDSTDRREEAISPIDAETLVKESDLVVVVDRYVGRIASRGSVVLLLSNLAYPNERVAAKASGWDGIWMPSDYLVTQFLGLVGVTDTDVSVVQPALANHQCQGDCKSFGVDVKDLGRKRLLFPHRLDSGKGLLDAVGLLGALAEGDPEWTLVVTGASGYNEPGTATLIGDTLELVSKQGLSRNFKLIPWIRQAQMPCFYASGHVTLVGSILPEAFGLVLHESLIAGVPVVSTKVGHLACPSVNVGGAWFVERLASKMGVEAVMSAYNVGVSSDTKYVLQQQYSRSSQRESLRLALASLRREVT